MALREMAPDNVVPFRRPDVAPITNTETKRELAGRLGVTPRSIERWMRMGLPHVKPFEHGMVRFVPAEVDSWLRRRQQPA